MLQRRRGWKMPRPHASRTIYQTAMKEATDALAGEITKAAGIYTGLSDAKRQQAEAALSRALGTKPGDQPALALKAKLVWPLWDGKESVGDYAKRVGLLATQTLDLGNGVKLELVLIPAGSS